jgi:SagB-type dehydrogenase family enzyme
VSLARGGAANAPLHPPPTPLDVLLAKDCAMAGIEDRLLDLGDVEALALWHALGPALEADGRLRYRVLLAGEPVFSLVPGARLASPVDATTEHAVRLSRFAYLRREGDGLVLESPRARGRVEVHGPRGVELIACLVTAHSAAEAAACIGQDAAFAEAAIGLLRAANVVLVAEDDDATAEDRDVHTRGWEFHDLLLHERSRTFRRDLRVGATNRFGESARSNPEPSRANGAATIPLARADLEVLAERDLPFTRVLESRRSIRFHASEPISITALGEFLFRTARATQLGSGADGSADPRFRLYPGGGACHPLEVYVVAARCAGLEPGLYRYLATNHELLRMEVDRDVVQSIVNSSAVPMEGGSAQQVQLVITARFDRINRRYEGNAYALILQEVGALYQTMYLVATAMGLAPCAVGGGNADRFARAIGADPLEEASVGGFVIGSR